MTSADVVPSLPGPALPHRAVALARRCGPVRRSPCRSRRPLRARAGSRSTRRSNKFARGHHGVAFEQVDRLAVETVTGRLPVRRLQRVRRQRRTRFAASFVVERRHHAGPEQRGQQHGLGDRRGHVGDAHLDRRELGRRADIPIDHAVVEHDAGARAASRPPRRTRRWSRNAVAARRWASAPTTRCDSWRSRCRRCGRSPSWRSAPRTAAATDAAGCSPGSRPRGWVPRRARGIRRCPARGRACRTCRRCRGSAGCR